MEENIVSFELAKLAKEKGLPKFLDRGSNLMCYDLLTGKVICYRIHIDFPSEDEYLYAPTQTLLQKWLRENHNIFLTIHCNSRNKYNYQGYDVDITKSKYKTDEYPGIEFGSDVCIFDTYEEALERGLIEALELI